MNKKGDIWMTVLKWIILFIFLVVVMWWLSSVAWPWMKDLTNRVFF